MRGIEMPPFNLADQASVKAWSNLSREYAQSASATVRAVVGESVRPPSVWQTVELPALKANLNVKQIVVIDPLTKPERWSSAGRDGTSMILELPEDTSGCE
jgi:hypothetical protein